MCVFFQAAGRGVEGDEKRGGIVGICRCRRKGDQESTSSSAPEKELEIGPRKTLSPLVCLF